MLKVSKIFKSKYFRKIFLNTRFDKSAVHLKVGRSTAILFLSLDNNVPFKIYAGRPSSVT